MRVLIDTTYARRAPFSGTAIYLDRLLDALSAIEGIEPVPVSNSRRGLPAGGGVGSVRNLLADLWWAEVELPRLTRRHRADVVHHPLPARSPRVRQVITAHDLAFERLPEYFDWGFRRFAHHAHRAAARAAGAVVCVSETTAADVRDFWAIPSERIVVARHGPGQRFAPVAPNEPRHFLYVGDAEPRKDLPTLLAAYALYRDSVDAPAPLILAGSASADGAGIEIVDRPSKERLGELYAGALALVHPSLYEGFGLTPLEAMGAGVPVLAARSPGVEEVCADVALYAEPRRPRGFAALMSRLAAEERLRGDLSQRGRRRAAEFSWHVSARSHAEAYRMAAGQRGGGPIL